MWSDRETRDDCLGFNSYVSSLADVCLEKDIAPLVLGIFGSWGSGKSSLMSMLKDNIDQESVRNKRRVKTLWFNAWRYEGKEEIQPALIQAVLRELEKDKSFLQDCAQVLGRLKKGASVLKLAKFITNSAITLTPNIGEFFDSFSDESEKLAETMQHFEADFGELLRLMQLERVVVFIDDLDRCSSAKVIQAFETIKLFLNVPESTFVIGADATKIEAAITEVYGTVGETIPRGGTTRSLAEEYLEKIVQIPFRIPEQRLPDIGCYVSMLCLRTYLSDDGWKALLGERASLLNKQGTFAEHLNDWLSQNGALCVKGASPAMEAVKRMSPFIATLADGLRGNPRQIKRFLNILEMRERLGRANNLDCDSGVLIKLLVIEYTWRSFFENVSETFDSATGRSELIDEMEKLLSDDKQAETGSAMLAEALLLPGLSDFVMQEPKLGGRDLTPYLFLAQTALHGQRPTALAPPEEKAKSLIERISGADRIGSKAAARRAAKEEAAIANVVVRGLLGRLGSSEDGKAMVHIVNGLSEICRQKPEHLASVIETLAGIVPSGKEAFALAAMPIFDAAQSKGIDVKAIREKYAAVSPIAKALGQGKKR